MKANQKDGTGDKIATIFQFLDSMERGLDHAKWRLEKRIKEIQEEQKQAREEYLLKKAEIVARLNEVWDEVDPMED
jgi:ubiquitin C-terminal hydrolase